MHRTYIDVYAKSFSVSPLLVVIVMAVVAIVFSAIGEIIALYIYKRLKV